MPEPLFPRYREAIRKLDLAQVAAPAQIPETFLLGREGRYSAHYIPFESIHPQARIVVAGITPGFVQWKNAMREAQRQLAAGSGDAEVLRAARLAGAFSGAIRPTRAPCSMRSACSAGSASPAAPPCSAKMPGWCR